VREGVYLKKLVARAARLSPAMVVAMLALFVALGGVSTAAQIQSKPQAAAAKKKPAVKRGPRGLRGLRGLRGAIGPMGPSGPQGPQGAPGESNPNAATLNGYAANGLVRLTRSTPSGVALGRVTRFSAR
jgi:hypothetical protein